MKKNFSVTVIIPVFNREKSIEATLKAVINQTLPPNEIIIIDNNSTDRTKSICLKYKNKCKLIFNPENYGPAISRNIALKKASSEYIVFMDSDDIPTKNYLESRVSKIIKNNAEIVYGSWAPVLIQNNIIKTDNFIRQSKKTLFPLTMFSLGWILFIPNCIIKKSLLLEVGGYPENYFANDIGLMCKLILKAKRISYTSKSLLLVRQHPKNQISICLSKEESLSRLIECYEDCMNEIFNEKNIPFFILKIRLKYLEIKHKSISKDSKSRSELSSFFLRILEKLFFLNNFIYKVLRKIFSGHTLPFLLKASPFNTEIIKEINLSGYEVEKVDIYLLINQNSRKELLKADP